MSFRIIEITDIVTSSDYTKFKVDLTFELEEYDKQSIWDWLDFYKKGSSFTENVIR